VVLLVNVHGMQGENEVVQNEAFLLPRRSDHLLDKHPARRRQRRGVRVRCKR